jgi:hypothetical protein
LAARLLDIDAQSLPKTFQDAVVITRQLGIPYLWIDSLCIVQSGDDGKDWRSEALRMGQYYQYSVLTIAATNAAESGLLMPQSLVNMSSAMNPLIRLPYRQRTGKQSGWFYVQQRDDGARSEYRESILNSDLLSRGWVFQEWMLSRRIIHYTSDQLWFECQSDIPSNGNNDRAHVLNDSTGNIYSHSKDLASLKNAFATGALATIVLWCRLIETYSGLALSCSTDRLVAITGIAKEVQSMMATETRTLNNANSLNLAYVARWWLCDIHTGLL